MATIVKGAGFIAFIRLFQTGFGSMHPHWQLAVAIITASTLLLEISPPFSNRARKKVGLFKYSPGRIYAFLAIVSLSQKGNEGLFFYTAAYSLATIGIFAVLLKMKDYTFEGFNGLAKREPVLAATTTIFLLSLAGIPGTAGFMGKLYMLSAAVENGKVMWLVILAVLCAVISVYYYFRVIQAMYF